MAVTSLILEPHLLHDLTTRLEHQQVDIDAEDPDTVEIFGTVLSEFVFSRGGMSFINSSCHPLFIRDGWNYDWIVDFWLEDIYAEYEPLIDMIMDYHAVHDIKSAIWSRAGRWEIGALLFYH